MTARELSQLRWLNREIGEDRRRLGELESAAAGGTARITGLPHTGAAGDRCALWTELAEARGALEGKIRRSVAEYNRLNRFIASVEDSLLRQILSLRFVRGLTWRQVAQAVGGGNTEAGVKMACRRFLERS